MFDTLRHPMLVHFPIALAVVMPFVTGGIALAWHAGALRRRALFIAVALQAVLVLSGVLALKSGEHDEEIAERAVSERLIEAHEEAAEQFMFAAAASLALLLGAAVLSDEKKAKLLALGAAGIGVVALGLAVRAGHHGGELVFRHGAAAPFVEAAARSDGQKLGVTDDDDDTDADTDTDAD